MIFWSLRRHSHWDRQGGGNWYELSGGMENGEKNRQVLKGKIEIVTL